MLTRAQPFFFCFWQKQNKQIKCESSPKGSAFNALPPASASFCRPLRLIERRNIQRRSETESKVSLRPWAGRLGSRLLGLCSKVSSSTEAVSGPAAVAQGVGGCTLEGGLTTTGDREDNRNSKLNVMKWFPCRFPLARHITKQSKKILPTENPTNCYHNRKGKGFFFFFCKLLPLISIHTDKDLEKQIKTFFFWEGGAYH